MDSKRLKMACETMPEWEVKHQELRNQNVRSAGDLEFDIETIRVVANGRNRMLYPEDLEHGASQAFLWMILEQIHAMGASIRKTKIHDYETGTWRDYGYMPIWNDRNYSPAYDNFADAVLGFFCDLRESVAEQSLAKEGGE